MSSLIPSSQYGLNFHSYGYRPVDEVQIEGGRTFKRSLEQIDEMESVKKVKSINAVIQSLNIAEPQKSRPRQFALVIMGQIEISLSKKSEQEKRLYETARCIVKIYKGLSKCDFSQKDIVYLVNKPCPSPYGAYSCHPDSEPEEYHAVTSTGLPTISTINQQLDHFAAVAKTGDTLWVFLIGHGNSKYGLLLNSCVNFADYLSPQQLESKLKYFDHQGVHTNLIADCCYAGQFLPLTSHCVTVLTSCHFEECSSSSSLKGKRYATQLISSLSFDPTKSLFEHHLKSVEKISPGYDSLLFYLDKCFFSEIEPGKILPDQGLPEYLSVVSCTILNPSGRYELKDSEEGFTCLSHLSTNEGPYDADKIRQSVIHTIFISYHLAVTAFNARYFYLKEKVRKFLLSAQKEQLVEFARIAAPLVGKLNLKKENV